LCWNPHRKKTLSISYKSINSSNKRKYKCIQNVATNLKLYVIIHFKKLDKFCCFWWNYLPFSYYLIFTYSSLCNK
jgi:hypothetical protein